MIIIKDWLSSLTSVRLISVSEGNWTIKSTEVSFRGGTPSQPPDTEPKNNHCLGFAVSLLCNQPSTIKMLLFLALRWKQQIICYPFSPIMKLRWERTSISQQVRQFTFQTSSIYKSITRWIGYFGRDSKYFAAHELRCGCVHLLTMWTQYCCLLDIFWTTTVRMLIIQWFELNAFPLHL